ncbi:MAG: FeoA family protein [Solitalea-like symbiont of Acarus siro]
MSKIRKVLSQLHLGESGTITDFKDNNLSIVLMEMGCLPGIKITLEGKAPLGGALAIKVMDYKLGLSMQEAESVVLNVS